MKIVIYADNTLPINIESLCNFLNKECSGANFYKGMENLHINKNMISCPASTENLSKSIQDETSEYDLALFGTSVPYDNNYFFEWHENKAFISFFGWNGLTDLPISNGFVYFIASILADIIKLGMTHPENTGCVNDFWGNKTGINLGMRAAYVCTECKQLFSPSNSSEKK